MGILADREKRERLERLPSNEMNTDAVFSDARKISHRFRDGAAIPPKDMGRFFDSQFSPLTRQVDVLTAANDNLRATRDLLLPRLISGEIDVSSLRLEVG